MSAADGATVAHSQLPGRPSFRSAAMHAVAIVPLTIPRRSGGGGGGDGGAGDAAAGGGPTATATTTHSAKSFHHLLASLREFASQGGPGAAQRRRSSFSASSAASSGSSGGGARDAASRKWSDESSEITLVVPHSQLTRPGDWRYNDTPLKSHDWSSGCQRVRLFDGRPGRSRMAYDRIGGDENGSNGGPSGKQQQQSKSPQRRLSISSSNSWKDPWKDLEPHRTTSAVVGVLNMRDCRDTRDLWRAEENLIQWARRYASDGDREDIVLGMGDNRNVLARLFVFDSFDECVAARNVDLNQTRFQSNQLVAFPPLDMGTTSSQMMVLHWNVVVNDLAVALFRNVERRIRENDVLGKSLVWNKQLQAAAAAQQGGSGSAGASSAAASASASASAASGNQGAASASERTDSTVTSATDDTSQSTESASQSSAAAAAAAASGPVGMGGRFLKNALDNTRKALANRQDSSASSVRAGSGSTAAGGVSRQGSDAAGGGGGAAAGGLSSSGTGGAGGGISSSEHRRKAGASSKGAPSKLVTPLDLDASSADNTNLMATLSARDMEALKRRDLGRREKRSADLSLLAGSPIDAYERYTRAAELTRHSHDPLWYASALEGCAAAFIAMADAGGHGVDEYLENNFQLPEEIMALAIAQGVASGADLGDGRGKTMTVDRTKTTLPQAVTALVEESMSVLCRHEKLAPLHAGLLMKLAEYVQEEEEGHLRCRWGEGEHCYGGGDVNAMTGELTPPRWARTSVSKLDLGGTEVRDMLALDSIERGRKFTELLHRAVSVGGLDDRSRADVAAACARACLIGTKVSGPSFVAII